MLSAAGDVHALRDEVVVNDLRDVWKVYKGGSFESYRSASRSDLQAIYFEVDQGAYPEGSVLRVRAAAPFSVYLNHQLLVFNKRKVMINIDSLARHVSGQWIFGVHQPGGFDWLETVVVSTDESLSNFSNSLRPDDYFLDFSIIASLLLIAFFIILLRTNPRLTFDYFNFARLFSIQEREDTLLNSRISASVNILYYGFSSLLAGFILLTVFQFGSNQIPVAEIFIVQSFGNGFVQWLKLSSVVVLALLAKLILTSVFSRMFDFREGLSFQFYNYVRLIFFVFTLTGFVCLCYFVLNIQSTRPYSFLLEVIIFLSSFWVLVIGLKLLRRSTLRFFQLFSYLCASEIIPIVVLVKVLNS